MCPPDPTGKPPRDNGATDTLRKEALTEITGAVAQDLGDRLTIILANIRPIIATSALPQPTREAALEILISAEKADRLIRAPFRLDAKAAGELEPVEMVAFVQKLRPILPPGGVLQGQLAGSLSPVWSDPELLEQSLLSLAENVAAGPGKSGTLALVVDRVTAEVVEHAAPEAATKANGVSVHCDFLRGDETVLFAEDEPLVREPAGWSLRGIGYRVVKAVSGDAALEVWHWHRAGIGLLITEVGLNRAISGSERPALLETRKASQ